MTPVASIGRTKTLARSSFPSEELADGGWSGKRRAARDPSGMQNTRLATAAADAAADDTEAGEEGAA